MDVSTYLTILRRWWLTLLVATWVAAIAGYVIATQIQPAYEARARVLVGPINGDLDTIRASSFLVQTYGELIESDAVLQETIDTLGLDRTVSQLRADVTAAANDQTRFLTIRASSSDPNTAAAIAQALVNRLVDLATRETRRPEGELQVINSAEVNPAPVSPQVPVVVILASLAGLLGAIVLVVLLEILTDAIRTRKELSTAIGAHSIGEIERPGRLARSDGPLLVVAAAPGSTASRQYREAGARLLLGVGGDRPPQVALVIGTHAADGSAEVAANLALAIAASGHRVALVDANDVDRTVSRLFRAEEHAGLVEALEDPGRTATARMPVSPNLELVPIGRGGPVPSDRDVDGLVRSLLGGANGVDVVVVDAAPLGRSAAALAWLRRTDATVLAIRRYRARRGDVVEAAEAIRLGTDRPVVTLLHEQDPVEHGRRRPPAGEATTTSDAGWGAGRPSTGNVARAGSSTRSGTPPDGS